MSISSPDFEPPSSILIVGSGVFGLSAAYALAQRATFKKTKITVLESPFPSEDGSSIDTSRIVRSDYSSPAYASLAARAQDIWRDNSSPSSLGGSGRYTGSGLVLLADKGKQGEEYVRCSLSNVRTLLGPELAKGIKELKNKEEIKAVLGDEVVDAGDWGYLNPYSGWADAEASMLWFRSKAESTNRIQFLIGEASSLIFSPSAPHSILGLKLSNGEEIHADLTIIAAGAWSGKLVDLRGRAQASGQVLCYAPLTAPEQESLAKGPVVLNLSSGMFTIPPPSPSSAPDRLKRNFLKVARHGYGYCNPVTTPSLCSIESALANEKITVSLPKTTWDSPNLIVPAEGQAACQSFLSKLLPSLTHSPKLSQNFPKSKICWYTDTPTGDFLISYHPEYAKGLFLATGGSGHAFKFLPVIGDSIVDCIEGRTPEEFKELWKWRTEPVDEVITEDGSRGGRRGMVLDEECRRPFDL